MMNSGVGAAAVAAAVGWMMVARSVGVGAAAVAAEMGAAIVMSPDVISGVGAEAVADATGGESVTTSVGTVVLPAVALYVPTISAATLLPVHDIVAVCVPVDETVMSSSVAVRTVPVEVSDPRSVKPDPATGADPALSRPNAPITSSFAWLVGAAPLTVPLVAAAGVAVPNAAEST
jgi:hypothetical protein